jgi:PKD repeat protein
MATMAAQPDTTRVQRLGRFQTIGVFAALAGLALTGTAIVASSIIGKADSAPTDPGDPATPLTVSADALPTVQIDGVVWSQAVIGNTVYVGGRFDNARPAGAAPGTNLTTRTNFLAYDLTTGNLITTFAPSFNAQVRSVVASPDGTRLYVGGDFTSVNGISRSRIASFDVATGNLVPFYPSVAYNVHAIAVHPSGSPVYVGGNFNAVGSVQRGQLAAFDASNGALLDWAPQATGGLVKAMAMSPDGTKVAVGGQFTALNGGTNPGYGLGMIDAVTGASLPMAINATVRNGGNTSGITSLFTSGDDLFGSGYWYGGPGNFEGVFSASWDGGATNWIADCHGDTHSVYVGGDAVYNVGHSHECGGMPEAFQRTEPWTFSRGIAFSRAATGTLARDPYGYFNFEGNPAPSMLNFFPALDAGTFTGQSQGPWNVAGNGQYVVMGGEFRNVNDQPQQGLVRFALPSIAPNQTIPRLFLSNWLPRVVSVEPGTARITWTGNWDRDNENFEYRVYRDTDGTLVYVGAGSSRWYNMPTYGFTDTGLTPGSTVRYRVKAIDPFGNEAPSDWVSVTVSGADPSSYASTVLSTRPLDYWRLGEGSGPSSDLATYDDLTINGSPTRNVTGAVPGDANTAMTFNGSSSQYGATQTARVGRQQFSVEAWVKTSSTGGGKIIGFGTSRTGNSSTNDRHLYIGNDGRVRFGVFYGSNRIVQSGSSIVDGQWHHVVGTLGGGAMRLYVDGVEVDSLTDVPMARTYTGYWRVGGDNLSGWANRPSSDYFNGTIDEPAVYPRALTAAEVAQNFVAGSTGTPPNLVPTAAFTATTSPLAVSVDGAASIDPDGAIVSYEWDFGDGGLANGVTASHTYAAPGTYTVTLTVTDDDGATDVDTQQVIVPDVPANVPPVAVVSASASALVVSVDGSGSSDVDGSVVSYAWDFGDGGSASGVTASHTYAAAGTYTVSLTVTDDDGAVGVASQSVVVTEVGVPQPFAVDAFGRTVASGWGAADLGGAWSLVGPVSNFAVNGSQGTLRMAGAGQGVSAFLAGNSTDTEVRATLSPDKAGTGGGIYTAVIGRRVGSSDYRGRVRFMSGGGVQLFLTRSDGGETNLANLVVPGLSVAPGEVLNVKLQVTGTSPTTVQMKVWKVGASEPAGWQLSATDAAAGLQAGGGVGFWVYLSGSATNAPVTITVDDLWAGTPV